MQLVDLLHDMSEKPEYLIQRVLEPDFVRKKNVRWYMVKKLYYITDTFLLNRTVKIHVEENKWIVSMDTIQNRYCNGQDFFDFMSSIRFISCKYPQSTINGTTLEYSGDKQVDTFLDFYSHYLYPIQDRERFKHNILKGMLYMSGLDHLYTKAPIWLYNVDDRVGVYTPFGRLLFGEERLPHVVLPKEKYPYVVIENAVPLVNVFPDEVVSKAIDSDKDVYTENNDVILYLSKIGSGQNVGRVVHNFLRSFHYRDFKAKNNVNELEKPLEPSYSYFPQNGYHFLLDTMFGTMRKVDNP